MIPPSNSEFFIGENGKPLVNKCPSYLLFDNFLDKVLYIGTAVTAIKRSKLHNLWPSSLVFEFAENLHKMSLSNTDVLELLEFLDVLKSRVTNILSSLLLKECHLKEHLESFRNFFLLGNGLFFNEFINHLDNRKNIGKITEYGIFFILNV